MFFLLETFPHVTWKEARPEIQESRDSAPVNLATGELLGNSLRAEKRRRIYILPWWWFQTFFIFTPTWGNHPIWLVFFKWVETTNQLLSLFFLDLMICHMFTGIFFTFLPMSKSPSNLQFGTICSYLFQASYANPRLVVVAESCAVSDSLTSITFVAASLVIVGMMYTLCSFWRMFYPHSSNPLGRYFATNMICVIN